MPSHQERITSVREAYRAAHDRFTARLRDASDADVHRQPADGGWSAAQIGWHVAAVDGSFAAVLSGDVAAARPLAEGAAKPWPEIAASMPQKIEAGRRVLPPPEARRDDVLAALKASAARLDAALAEISEQRATGYAITHPVVGTVALGQIGEWATAHVIRHNAQAKRALAEAAASGQ